MSLTNLEFFSYEREVWVRFHDGQTKQLKESDRDIIDEFLAHISTFYPEAYDALCVEYGSSQLNKPYFHYRMATRFIRCNLSQLDNIPDFSESCRCSFEYVSCPLRGECRNENIICRPKMNRQMSSAEAPVLRLWFDGLSLDDIADRLHLSPHTVNNHIRRVYARLGLHRRSDFVRYAVQHSLFS